MGKSLLLWWTWKECEMSLIENWKYKGKHLFEFFFFMFLDLFLW